ATWEAIASAHTEQPRGLMFYVDEVTSWVRSMNQYRQGRGADRQHWLSAWSGAPVTIVRRTLPEPIVIPHPALCVLGGLPPDALADLTDEQGRDDGFIHRVLFVWPDVVPIRWTSE